MRSSFSTTSTMFLNLANFPRNVSQGLLAMDRLPCHSTVGPSSCVWMFVFANPGLLVPYHLHFFFELFVLGGEYHSISAKVKNFVVFEQKLFCQSSSLPYWPNPWPVYPEEMKPSVPMFSWPFCRFSRPDFQRNACVYPVEHDVCGKNALRAHRFDE